MGIAAFAVILVTTATNYIVLGWKIHQKKRQLESQENSQQHQFSNNGSGLDATSLLDFKSAMLLISLMIFMAALGFLTSLLAFGEVSFQLAVRGSGLAGVILVMPLSMYARRPHLRKVLRMELTQWMKKFVPGRCF